MEDGSISIDDCPNEVLREERIKKVYKTSIQRQAHPKVAAPQLVLLPDVMMDQRDTISINESLLENTPEFLSIKSPIPLRTMSSGVVGSGTGWHQNFVNRHVDKGYNCSDYYGDMLQFLRNHHFEPGETVGMMTAVYTEDVSCRLLEDEGFSVFIVVTAGVGNAVDAARSYEHVFQLLPGTINTWVFVNGSLTEEAFIQSIMTATEAKAKALHKMQVHDSVTGTIATGTSTDSILIAATQKGKELEFAGTITPLGKLIGKGVYECTMESIKKSSKRVKRK